MSPGSRSSRRSVVAVITALVTLIAVVLVGLFLRNRWQSDSASSTASGRASSSPSPVPSDVTKTCEPGQSGPLRMDTRFTAEDGRSTVVRYSISLPDDYYSACRDYPVLYALHGKNQNNASFLDDALAMRKAMTAGVLEQSIIVTPDSYDTGRWENREPGPAEDNFIQRLIPHIEQTYRVKPGPSYRMLVGFSMGGHGAIRFGLKYPEMFASVWSVDGAMARDPEDYLPFIEGKTSDDFRIIAVGGELNGDRVQGLIDSLKQRGIEIPYVYQDREHTFRAFVDEDEKAGWYAMKYLQKNLGTSG